MKKALVITFALVCAFAIAVVAGRRTRRPRRRPTRRHGYRGDVPLPAHLEVDPRGRQGLRDQHHVLADRLRRRDRQRSPRGPSTSARPMPRCPRHQLDACKGCVVIPWALAATSIPYNLPGVDGRCSLNGPTLANIYLGTITSWNDAAIKKLNPKLTPPRLKITPVYRSDGSGTTYAFTEYLSAVSRVSSSRGRQQHERRLPDRRRRPRELGRHRSRQEHAGRR